MRRLRAVCSFHVEVHHAAAWWGWKQEFCSYLQNETWTGLKDEPCPFVEEGVERVRAHPGILLERDLPNVEWKLIEPTLSGCENCVGHFSCAECALSGTATSTADS